MGFFARGTGTDLKRWIYSACRACEDFKCWLFWPLQICARRFIRVVVNYSYGLRPTEMSPRIEVFVGTFSWLFMMALIAATIAAMFG